MPPRKGSQWSEARHAACTAEYRERLSIAKQGAVPWNAAPAKKGRKKQREPEGGDKRRGQATTPKVSES